MNQQLIPYFISSHPGCTEADMANLAIQTKKLHFQLEQVQDFTPTPMTLATEMYYTGYHPYTLEKVYTARTKEQKLAQRQFFFLVQAGIPPPDNTSIATNREKGFNRQAVWEVSRQASNNKHKEPGMQMTRKERINIPSYPRLGSFP